MKIHQSFDSTLTGVHATNTIENQPENNKVQNNSTGGANSTVDAVTISSQGNLNQSIDSLFDKADAIFQSHITPKQQKYLNESYAKLDELFSKNSPSDAEQKSADAIFDKIDQIFELAEKKLSPAEKEQIAAIDTKLDELLGADDMQFEDAFSEEIDDLFKKSEDLLTSKLNNSQKKSLDELNQQLNTLFEKNNVDDEAVDGIFDKIDSILNQGYDKLSANDKEKLTGLDKEIDQLFGKLDSQEDENVYSKKV